MKTILGYLDNMFMNLPHTQEIKRAKEELATMMEDKYNELIADGKKENEAVGIVISEFGNLQELAVELGLGEIVDKQTNSSPVKTVSMEEVDEYITLSEQTSKKIAIGVMLCIYSPIVLILLFSLQEYKMLVSENIATSVGISVLLIMLVAAISIFILSGVKMEKFEYLKTQTIAIDSYVDNYLKKREEDKKFGDTVLTIIAIALCILGVIPLIVVGTIFENNEFLEGITLISLLLIVGVAVYLFIVAGTSQECIKTLRQVEDFSKEGKKTNKIIDRISGPYWILTTLIYLSWSFITMEWGYTWIVWPISGILFGLISAILSSFQKNENVA